MRHLLIGNSHLAALKLGWDKIARKHRDTELVFTGARGTQLTRVHLDGNIVTSDSPQARKIMAKLAGTDQPIDVTSFDRCWIVGGQLSVLPYMRLYSNYRSEAHPDLGQRTQILSETAFNLAASSALDEASAIGLAAELVSAGCDVGFIPQPMPSHAVIAERSRWRDLADGPNPTIIAELFADALAAIAARVGATVYSQPSETLQTPITTRSELARGSVGLTDNSHDDDDTVHMNGKYGREVLEHHLLA